MVGDHQAGYNVRIFADRFPDKVAGLVFVDALHPDADLTEAGFSDNFLRGPEWFDFPTSAAQAEATGALGDLPIYVLTAGDRPSASEWAAWQEGLAALSTDSRYTTLDGVSPRLQNNDPNAIVKAVRSVLTRAS